MTDTGRTPLTFIMLRAVPETQSIVASEGTPPWHRSSVGMATTGPESLILKRLTFSSSGLLYVRPPSSFGALHCLPGPDSRPLVYSRMLREDTASSVEAWSTAKHKTSPGPTQPNDLQQEGFALTNIRSHKVPHSPNPIIYPVPECKCDRNLIENLAIIPGFIIPKA